MDIQVAALCDSASDYGGKLCVLGTFDTICAAKVPVVHPQCAIALRICVRPEDEGECQFQIAFIDMDGKHVMPPFQAKLEVKVPSDAMWVTRNLVMNIQRLKFKEAGHFSIDIMGNGKMLERIPLRVMLMDEMPNRGGGHGGKPGTH
ncbi:MAG: hypothetical protein AAGD22_04850 [Verrucomicrobiota bacterium]